MEVGENLVDEFGWETVQVLPRALHGGGRLTAGQRELRDRRWYSAKVLNRRWKQQPWHKASIIGNSRQSLQARERRVKGEENRLEEKEKRLATREREMRGTSISNENWCDHRAGKGGTSDREAQEGEEIGTIHKSSTDQKT